LLPVTVPYLKELKEKQAAANLKTDKGCRMDERARGKAGFHIQKDTTAHEAMRLACDTFSRPAAHSGIDVRSKTFSKSVTGISWS
jgi:hypothetical protein